MEDYYYATYLSKIISRAFRYSFVSIGGPTQIVLDAVGIAYYFVHRQESPASLMDALIVTGILVFVFLVIFLINLIYEFRWATPDIKMTPRPIIVEGGKIMVVLDVFNNEADDIEDCCLKLNKFVILKTEIPLSENIVPEHLSERFFWTSEEEKITIPSLENKIVKIAKENPDVSGLFSSQGIQVAKENLLLGLCTNKNRSVFPEQNLEDSSNFVTLNLEAELTGKIDGKRIFPKKFYGRIFFKKYIDVKLNNKPVTWLDLKKIKSGEMKKKF
ncbi:MAG: hypothetical protein WA821_09385 [Anaerolineales bacterium]